MENIQTITGKLTNLKRLPSSRNGNPRFQATIEITEKIKGQNYEITFKTSDDSSHGYSIQNFEGLQVIATIGWHYNVLTLNSIKKVV